MTKPTTMQWVVYDMQRRKPIAWHFSESDAATQSALFNSNYDPGERPITDRYYPMSRAVLLRISQAGNQ